jgi:hypothetical protein
MSYTYDLRIAGIHIRILAPRPLQFPESYREFLDSSATQAPPDWVMNVSFDSQNIPVSDGDYVKQFSGRENEPYLRIEPANRGKPCWLVVPESLTQQFCEGANWSRFLMPERILLAHNRVFLHASGVIHEGEGILFTAPSGGGKSTQASLWESTLGAEIFNGDKVIIAPNEEPPLCYGGPIAGSSLIYKNVSAPLKAIVYLHKSPENRVIPLDERRAFMVLYSQMVKSPNDSAFNRSLLPLIAKIVNTTQIVELYCRPDTDAVYCLQDWFKSH